MSAVGFRAVTAQISTGTSAKTLVQVIAASNHRVLLTEVQIAFEGVSATDAPIQVDILRQTDAGTMSALTLVKANSSDSETLEVTAQHTSTGEPTSSDVLLRTFIHPQSAYRAIVSRENAIVIPGGGRVGIRVTAANSVDAIVTIGGEE